MYDFPLPISRPSNRSFALPRGGTILDDLNVRTPFSHIGLLRERVQQSAMDPAERTVAHHQYVVTRLAARHDRGYQCTQMVEALRFRAQGGQHRLRIPSEIVGVAEHQVGTGKA